MDHRQNLDSFLPDSIDDPIRMLVQFTDQLIFVLRHLRPQRGNRARVLVRRVIRSTITYAYFNEFCAI